MARYRLPIAYPRCAILTIAMADAPFDAGSEASPRSELNRLLRALAFLAFLCATACHVESYFGICSGREPPNRNLAHLCSARSDALAASPNGHRRLHCSVELSRGGGLLGWAGILAVFWLIAGVIAIGVHALREATRREGS
jgi:hypothetical protein